MTSPSPPHAIFESAARAALREYALEAADLALIAHRENAVFRVTSPRGTYALRVHRPGYHDEVALVSELAWMQALASLGLDVPAIVPARTGDLRVRITPPGTATALVIDLVEWMPGEPLRTALERHAGDTAWQRRTWHALGALVADIHEHAAGWQPPPGFTRPAWDADGLAGPDPVWGRFWELPSLDREQRVLLVRAREHVHRALAALPKTADVYGLIHADVLPENVLVDDTGVRLIDFDDSGWGWHLFELVTPLHAVRHEPWHDAALDALLDGYRSRRRLEDATLERLSLFFLVRALTDVGWVHTRAETEAARRSASDTVACACELAEAWLRAPRTAPA
ncbi:MAG TPA: phosphotransferase [Woeseiaceae bacterium]|nr:phosphotransferase [Woeseiaceae bacterium]